MEEVLEKIEVNIGEDLESDYAIYMYDDDAIPADYVVGVLMQVFSYDTYAAVRLTLDVDREGMGLVGIYPRSDAERFMERVERMNEMSGYMLIFTMEKVEE